MKLRRLIRHNARCALQGNWPGAIAVVLTAMAVSLLFVTLGDMTARMLGLDCYLDLPGTPGLFLDDIPNPSPMLLAVLTAWTLLYALAALPLRIGVLRWFYGVGNGEGGAYRTIFGFYASRRRIARVLTLHVRIFARVTAVLTASTLLPGALFWLSGRARARALSDADALLALEGQAASLLLGLLLLVFALIWSMRYHLAPFILLDEPELPTGEILARAVQASDKRRVDLFLLECSLLPWRLLGLLQFPMLYTAPLVSTVRGLYARYLLECHAQNIFAD